MHFDGVPSTDEIRSRLAQEREAEAVKWAESRTREAVEQWTRERDEYVATITTFPERARHEREVVDNERAAEMQAREYSTKLHELTSHQQLLEQTFQHVEYQAAELNGHADVAAAQALREAQSVLLHETAYPGATPETVLSAATTALFGQGEQDIARRDQAAHQEQTIRALHPELALSTDPQTVHVLTQYASPLESTAPELTHPPIRDASVAVERGNDGVLRQGGVQVAREMSKTATNAEVLVRTDLTPESYRAIAEHARAQGYTTVALGEDPENPGSAQMRWREYSVVGMQARGYEPTQQDLDYVREQRELREQAAQAREARGIEKSGSEVGREQAQPSAPQEVQTPAVANQVQAQQQATAHAVEAPVVTPTTTQAPSPADQAPQAIEAPAAATAPTVVAAELQATAVAGHAPQNVEAPAAGPSRNAEPVSTPDNPGRVNVTRHNGSPSMSDRMTSRAPAERSAAGPQMSERMTARRAESREPQPEMSARMASISQQPAVPAPTREVEVAR